MHTGGVVACGRVGSGGGQSYVRAFGTYTFESNVPVTTESIFDVASLTKILATATAILLLQDRGLLSIEDRACSHLPEFSANGKGEVTIRHLLTHSAGLKEWYNFKSMGLETKQKVADFVLKEKPLYSVGTEYRYSDLSMIALGLIVEKVSGCSLDTFVKENIFTPLGMESTGYRGIDSSAFDWDTRIVPTSVEFSEVRERLLWGEVHDLNAYLMGGIAGHAGLFSNVADLVKFCAAILRQGKSETTGKPIYSPKASKLFLSRLSSASPYGFGWNLCGVRKPGAYCSGGQHLSHRAVGHTGFTGTSMWLDPINNFYIVVLTNAVHPGKTDQSDRIREVRSDVADAAFELCFPEKFAGSGMRKAATGAKPTASLSMSALSTEFSSRVSKRWKHWRDLALFFSVCLWSAL